MALLDHRFRHPPRKIVASQAVQFLAEAGCATFLGSDPGPLPPRRIIADMLPMSALKFGDPVVFGVEMVTDDLALHVNITAVVREGTEWADSSDFGSLVVGDEPPLARLAPKPTRARGGSGMAHLYAQGEGGAREKLLWIKGAVIPSPSG